MLFCGKSFLLCGLILKKMPVFAEIGVTKDQSPTDLVFTKHCSGFVK